MVVTDIKKKTTGNRAGIPKKMPQKVVTGLRKSPLPQNTGGKNASGKGKI